MITKEEWTNDVKKLQAQYVGLFFDCPGVNMFNAIIKNKTAWFTKKYNLDHDKTLDIAAIRVSIAELSDIYRQHISAT